MSESRTNETASSPSLVTSSKEYERKDFDTSSNDEEDRKSTESMGPSPSNQSFLSNLKSFNIDRSQYKHYGHQSSLTAQSLEKVMRNEGKVDETDTSDKYKDAEKKVNQRRGNRIKIDEKISQILGIPQQTMDEESIWPYNTETLNEILRFKTEQERTKQESIKSEYGSTTVELLRLAKSLNISSDLIPFLFITNTSVEELHVRIEQIQKNPSEVLSEAVSKSRELAPQIPKLTGKRKHSDFQLPSFSETAEYLRSQSAIISPERSPNKSPVNVHRRTHSDNTESVDKGSPSQQNIRPSPIYSRKHSPQLHLQTLPPNMYPVYYTTGPPPPNANQHSGSQGQPNKTGEQGSPSSSGSPPAQKYPAVKYTQGPYQNGPAYIPAQYPYYVPPGSNVQYLAHGAPPQGLIPPAPMHHFPSPEQDFMRGGRHSPSNSGGKSYPNDFDETSPYKKQKSSKNSGINFMITTPKNPPARKYNNPTKEKST